MGSRAAQSGLKRTSLMGISRAIALAGILTFGRFSMRGIEVAVVLLLQLNTPRYMSLVTIRKKQ